MGDLRQNEDEEYKPWERNKTNYKLSKSDFPDTVYVTKANMLYISKNGFSHKALNIVKRLAAFKNPDFYKAQAMRLPTFDKPRIISLSDDVPEYLCLPRGCESDLINLFNTYKLDVKCIDKCYSGKQIDVEFNGQLRDEQEDAVGSMLQHDNGVLSATTAFGKTVIGAKIISVKKVNTLILVHTQQLLEQWKERLNQFLVINEELPSDEIKKRGRKKSRSIIGQLGGGKNNNKLIIDDVIKSVNEGRNPIVLTERTAHVEVIANALKEVLPNVITLTGGMSAKERKAALERLSSITAESNIVIVATGKFVGEGFDEPRLDTLFLAMPVAWKGTVQQYAGRLHRLYQNKSEVQIYDYVDVHVGVLERMYQKRLKGYASIGYSARGDSRPFESLIRFLTIATS